MNSQPKQCTFKKNPSDLPNNYINNILWSPPFNGYFNDPVLNIESLWSDRSSADRHEFLSLGFFFVFRTFLLLQPWFLKSWPWSEKGKEWRKSRFSGVSCGGAVYMTSKAKTTQDPLFLTDGRDPPKQVIDTTFLIISNALQYHPKVAGCYPLPRRNQRWKFKIACWFRGCDPKVTNQYTLEVRPTKQSGWSLGWSM